MFSALFKIFLLLILMRVGWGVLRGIRLMSRAAKGAAGEEEKPFDGTEIEDADWEEIEEDDRNSS